MTHLAPQIPDYQRLCELSSRFPNLDPDDVTAVLMIRAVAAELATKLQQSLDRYDISEGRVRVLAHLIDRDTAATHSQLALATGVTKGTVTGLIDGLERDGLVRRVPSPHDRRVSLIEITPAGKRTLHRILPGHLRRLSEMFGGLSRKERKQLIHLLEKVRANLCPNASRTGAEKRP